MARRTRLPIRTIDPPNEKPAFRLTRFVRRNGWVFSILLSVLAFFGVQLTADELDEIFGWNDGLAPTNTLYVSVIVAVLASLLFAYVVRQFIPPIWPDRVQVLEFDDFRSELMRLYKDAKDEIWLSGTGFQDDGDFAPALERREDEAVRRGVRLSRIQTSTFVSPSWAAHLEQLARLHDVAIYQDFSDFDLFDVFIMDPSSRRPRALILLENPAAPGTGEQATFVQALLISEESIVRRMARQFLSRVKEPHVTRLSIDHIQELGQSVTYFSWGTSLSREGLASYVRGYRDLGRATVRGYRRILSQDDSGVWLSIEVDSAAEIAGVAYELSPVGMRVLDTKEPYYRRRRVPVVLHDVDGQYPREAYMFLPEDFADIRPEPLDAEALTTMKDGALEKGYVGLAAELLRYLDGLQPVA